MQEVRSWVIGYRLWVFCLFTLTSYLLPLTSAVHASVSLKAEVDKNDALIGDRIIYTLYVTADKNLDIELPLDSPDFTPFDFIGQRGIERSEAQGRITYKIEYVLAAYAVGELYTPPQTIYFRDAKGKEGEVSSEKIKIVVKGVVPKGGKEIMPEKGPIEVEIKRNSAVWLLAGTSVIMAAVIISAFVYLKMMTKQMEIPEPVLASKDIALSELGRITGLGLLGKGDFKLFHKLTADCLKKFACDGIHIPPSGLTTMGLLNMLKVDDGLKDILKDCNLVEFANYSPTNAQSMDIMKRARRAVSGE
ncbi:MAG: hypothetical protein HZC45_06385 [Deltaproteobacteria bacterium]|nr:hypothetical protein [Deltaproteobacteria bacterium]